MLLSQAIEEFNAWRALKVRQSTVSTYHGALRQFCIYMKNCELEAIRLEDIITWFTLMEVMKYETNSFIPIAIALRKFFEFFQHRGFPVIDPWLIPVPHKKFEIPRVATQEHYDKLLVTIPKNNDPRHVRNRAIITMLWDTGARVGELLSLNLSEVNMNEKKAIINTEKNRGSRPFREIFWTEPTNDNLIRWAARRQHLLKEKWKIETDAFFVSCTSSMVGQRLTIKGVGEALRRYSNRAKIPYMNAHSYRHAKGHKIVHSGGSAADVMNVLGHASLASSTPYVAMWGKELEGVAKKYL